jgi:hypothetical protein
MFRFRYDTIRTLKLSYAPSLSLQHALLLRFVNRGILNPSLDCILSCEHVQLG